MEEREKMTIWAFAKIDDTKARKAVYESIKNGKSRFGWSSNDKDNLKKYWNGKHAFLLSIKARDWIVHVNMPKWGMCVVAKVVGEYDFDDGVKCSWGNDFRHNIPIDVETIVEFDRRSVEILPTVNLNPRQRYQRVYAVVDFLRSIENVKTNAVKNKKDEDETKGIFFLKEKSNDILKKITTLIHENHKGKNLERYFARVFRQMPNVVDVNENGFGWKKDYGADLIVTTSTAISNIQFENKIVVQIKSYTGVHYDLNAVRQVETAIEKFDASAGIIITTATKTKELEKKVEEVSQKIDKQIELIAGEDVAKFVIKYDKEQTLIFNLNY